MPSFPAPPRTPRPAARRRVAAAAGCLALTATALAGCSSDAGPGSSGPAPSFSPGTTMARIAQAGQVTVGTKFDQPGFGLKGLDGSVKGFDAEIAKLIAAGLGVPADKIKFVETPSKVREEVLEQKKVDFVVATYTVNDKRRQRVTFAGPYYQAGQDLLVAKGDTSLTGPDSLKANPGAKVCSVTGSTPAETIKKYLAAPDQLVLFDVYSKCADALRTGQVRAVTTDNVILLGLAEQSGGKFTLVGKPFTVEPYGIGLPKGDLAFCAFVNDTLRKAAADGSYAKAWTSTAGTVEGATTPTLPTADPCR